MLCQHRRDGAQRGKTEGWSWHHPEVPGVWSTDRHGDLQAKISRYAGDLLMNSLPELWRGGGSGKPTYCCHSGGKADNHRATPRALMGCALIYGCRVAGALR